MVTIGYVVVFNKNSSIPLRHIITTAGPYSEAEFKEWYYSEYHELEGDEFIYCTTREIMEKTVECVQNDT